ERPNVIIIITDDQGYGDFGFTGNPHVKTPNLDELAGESVRFNNFYVSPVCAPTRSSLMTGRYSLRTGVRDTYNGGAIMASNEVTIAEMLKEQGYTTGIFGKWHLGDNYPSRPSDQGFDESLIHLSGGMGQVGDFTTYYQKDRSYFDPVLWHNNEQESYEGYCSDIFADNAIQFIEEQKDGPFFCYLSFNAPHTPLQVPDEYYEVYKDTDPSKGFEGDDRPFPEMTDKDKEDARRVYAMVQNIDDNLGKLFKKLDDLSIAEETILIFMTDNGPQQRRYKAGLRARKGSVYRGGVRVPLLFRYPKFDAKVQEVDATVAHLDILPTLADLCQADLPKLKRLDGKNMRPLLEGESVDAIDNRSLFFTWTRKSPELYSNMALQKGPYKLVGQTDYNAPITNFELFNIEKDPYEQNNLIEKQTTIASGLKQDLDNLYADLIQSPNLAQPPLIEVGRSAENPIYLNRNDASGERGIWAAEDIFGQWAVDILPGKYDFIFKFIEPVNANGKLYLETNQIVHQKRYKGSTTDVIEMRGVHLPGLKGVLTPFYAVDGRRIFPFWVKMEKVD
ncbi:MAG: arylsulfatase, partial [Bacteroidota bacterium]